MNAEQTAILNSLLRMRYLAFTTKEAAWLILLSQRLRYTQLTRNESLTLQEMSDRLLPRDPDHDPGMPDDFGGFVIAPIQSPRDAPAGGPGGERPPGTGDGNSDLPDRTARVRWYGDGPPGGGDI